MDSNSNSTLLFTTLFHSLKILTTAISILIVLSISGQSVRPVGINLSPVQDFSSEFAFVDAFQQSRTWISHNADGSGPWDTGINIPSSEKGYPLSIPYEDGLNPPQAVRALVLWDLAEPFPSGQYRLIVEGSGQVTMEFGASGTFSCPVDTLITISDAAALRIDISHADDPISEIHLIRPAYTDGSANQTFTEEFLSFLEDFELIRFMDWMRTNNSPVTHWTDRTPVAYYTQTRSSGVAYEYIVDLVNSLEKDIWINIPHQATDAYVTQLAEFLEQELNPDIQIYLEYSNELWNGIFLQSVYASEMGSDLGFSGQSWEQGWKYTAYRSAQVFELFESAFEDDERIVKIIPSQSANPWLSGQLIDYFNDNQYNPLGIEADALAIAPYFANEVANNIVTNNEVNSIAVEDIVERMSLSLNQTELYITENKAVAEAAGLDLIAYEGGQHLVGTGGNENIDILTQKLVAANHHPDLEEVYCDYLDFWYEESGGLFTHFNSHYPYSKWGSWGLKETMGDFENPKYLAMQNCVFAESPLSVSDASSPIRRIKVQPNPSADGHFHLTDLRPEKNRAIYDMLGKQVKVEFQERSAEELQFTIERSGLYFFRNGSQVIKLVVE